MKLFETIKSWFSHQEEVVPQEERELKLPELDTKNFSDITRGIIAQAHVDKMKQLQLDCDFIEEGIDKILAAWQLAATEGRTEYFTWDPALNTLTFDPEQRTGVLGNIESFAIPEKDSDFIWRAHSQYSDICKYVAEARCEDKFVLEWNEFHTRMLKKFTLLLKQDVMSWSFTYRGRLILTLREKLHE